jgi:hypothetical protein
MANLLPKKEQNALKREYSLRRFDVILFLVCVVLAVSLILLFPSYILSKVRATNVSAELEIVKKATNAANPTDDLTLRLREAKEKAVTLQVFEKNLSVYDLIHTFETKSPSIKLKDISYTRGIDDVLITIQGRAGDRESLTTFQKQIKAYPNFSRVDLPISNFAKDKDIDFTMKITVKK